MSPEHSRAIDQDKEDKGAKDDIDDDEDTDGSEEESEGKTESDDSDLPNSASLKTTTLVALLSTSFLAALIN